MKVLVATRKTQGQRDNDFFWCEEGELVYPGGECDSDRGNPDGACGCVRGFSGIKTKKATTTALVVDKPFDQVVESLGEEIAGLIAKLTEPFRVGDVLEKRGSAYDMVDYSDRFDIYRVRQTG